MLYHTLSLKYASLIKIELACKISMLGSLFMTKNVQKTPLNTRPEAKRGIIFKDAQVSNDRW